jgi:hypothetical protein
MAKKKSVQILCQPCYGDDAFFKKEKPKRFAMCVYATHDMPCAYKDKCVYLHSLERFRNHEWYKTRPCMRHLTRGDCPQGDLCGYFHSVDEQRFSETSDDTSATTANYARKGPHNPVVPQMCIHTFQRDCPAGASCMFCHTTEQLAKIYKTRACERYWSTGRCERGNYCGFYHDPHEIRTREQRQHTMLAVSLLKMCDDMDDEAFACGRMSPSSVLRDLDALIETYEEV